MTARRWRAFPAITLYLQLIGEKLPCILHPSYFQASGRPGCRCHSVHMPALGVKVAQALQPQKRGRLPCSELVISSEAGSAAWTDTAGVRAPGCMASAKDPSLRPEQLQTDKPPLRCAPAQHSWTSTSHFQGMEGCASGRALLPVAFLLGCCLLLSSATVLPHLRIPNRLWKRNAPEYPSNHKVLDPFILRPSTWGLQLPSFILRDWSIKMMSSGLQPNQPSPAEQEGKPPLQPAPRHLLYGPANAVEPRKAVGVEAGLGRILLGQGWIPDWPSGEEKRSIVLADDAAFREKSKMLTAMERQKWLNSYMQKLLVVNSN
ncbi:hypothetical protein NDU88_009967 [Pleurodeles waltl]|uniref:Tuberoinfundibular peptide of 39 residues n=1 Tax=Pleurodeles waltl TaxID=8319 RepID=A0AAV7PWI1_PLEWA|nr:hypothetical protein NDU88_009967 [Pleurodeles waltl]